MLNEDALLLVAALAATGLVVLGALELVCPTDSTWGPRNGPPTPRRSGRPAKPRRPSVPVSIPL